MDKVRQIVLSNANSKENEDKNESTHDEVDGNLSSDLENMSISKRNLRNGCSDNGNMCAISSSKSAENAIDLANNRNDSHEMTDNELNNHRKQIIESDVDGNSSFYSRKVE